MNKLFKRYNLILMCFVLIIISASCVVSADDSILSYKSHVYIKENGVAEYTTNINILFNEPVDYYIYYLPSELDGKLSNIEVESYDYEYSQQYNAIKIWTNDSQFSGRKNITISYRTNGVNNYGKTADYIDLYLLPNNSPVIEKLSISIKYHDGFEWVKLTSDYDKWNNDKGARTLELTETDYINNGGMQVHFELPIGYWANATELGMTRNFALIAIFIGIIVFVIMRLVFNNDEQIDICECKYPPESVTPAQAGYAIDGIIDDRDFVASLIYIAHEGYIRIVEYELRKFKFIYLNEPVKTNKSIIVLMKILFDNCSIGDEVYLENIYSRIKKNMRKFKRAVYHDFNGRFRFLTTASNTAGFISIITFFVVVAILPLMNYINRGVNAGNITNGIIASIIFAAVITILLAVVCNTYRKMKSRRGDGNSRRFTLFCVIYAVACGIYIHVNRYAYNGRQADWITAIMASVFLIIAPLMLMGMRTYSKDTKHLIAQIKGLQQFIETADKSDVKDISKNDNEYFFTVLPYSYLFCKSHKLASLFELSTVDAPKWYKPYGLSDDYVYDVVVFNSMTNNLQQQLYSTVFKTNAE